MNKKGIIADDKPNRSYYIGILFVIIGLAVVIAFGVSFIKLVVKEHKISLEYYSFCEERPNFCYCNMDGCEYKIESTQSCVNGVCGNYTYSKETLELCEFAKKLNDKELLFKANCNE